MFGIIKKNVYYMVFEKKSMVVGPLPRWAPCPILPCPSCNVAIYCNSTEAVRG